MNQQNEGNVNVETPAVASPASANPTAVGAQYAEQTETTPGAVVRLDIGLHLYHE
jgi:hypothetical protein